MVVPAMGIVVTTPPAGYATTTPGTVSGVVVVVVVVTERVGAGGGGAETRCDSGSLTQPARMPMAKTGAMRLMASLDVE